MKSLLSNFVQLNVLLSNQFERLFSFRIQDRVVLQKVLTDIAPDLKIADVGGGKKPAVLIAGKQLPTSCEYHGYDISLAELSMSTGIYTEIFCLDLCANQSNWAKTYDLVLCLNTLEHVKDVETAISHLAQMINPGGTLYLKLPCRNSVFARLNLIIPQTIKLFLLHFIFPSKKTDGFLAFYDRCTPKDIIELCEEKKLYLTEFNGIQWSSYFRFFFPFYVVWRVISCLQALLSDTYCESFEISFRLPSESGDL